jgi:hypothetical protein
MVCVGHCAHLVYRGARRLRTTHAAVHPRSVAGLRRHLYRQAQAVAVWVEGIGPVPVGLSWHLTILVRYDISADATRARVAAYLQQGAIGCNAASLPAPSLPMTLDRSQRHAGRDDRPAHLRRPPVAGVRHMLAQARRPRPGRCPARHAITGLYSESPPAHRLSTLARPPA